MDLGQRPIRQYMTTTVRSVSVGAPLAEVAAELSGERISCLPVLGRDGTVAGVISQSDLLQIGHVMARHGDGKQLLTLPAMCAGDLMTAKVLAASPDDTVATAARRMVERSVHRLFVLDGGKPAGVFSARDLMAVLIEAKVRTELAALMTKPVVTVEAKDPLSLAAERLYLARVAGVVVVEDGLPAGLFTQVEALAAREQPRDTPVGEAAGYSMVCLPERMPVFRAASFVRAARARRAVALGEGGITGILSGLDFVRAALDAPAHSAS